MLVQPITNQNYQPNFQAMKLGRKNPNVSQEVRQLAEKATDLIEKVQKRRINVDGVIIGDRNTLNRPFTLSKNMNKKNVTLKMYKNEDGSTALFLDIDNPNSRSIEKVYYNSNTTYYCGKYYSKPKKGELFRLSLEDKNPNCESYCSNDFEKANKIFVKYVTELLKPAEKIAELFK